MVNRYHAILQSQEPEAKAFRVGSFSPCARRGTSPCSHAPNAAVSLVAVAVAIADWIRPHGVEYSALATRSGARSPATRRRTAGTVAHAT